MYAKVFKFCKTLRFFNYFIDQSSLNFLIDPRANFAKLMDPYLISNKNEIEKIKFAVFISCDLKPNYFFHVLHFVYWWFVTYKKNKLNWRFPKLFLNILQKTDLLDLVEHTSKITRDKKRFFYQLMWYISINHWDKFYTVIRIRITIARLK